VLRPFPALLHRAPIQKAQMQIIFLNCLTVTATDFDGHPAITGFQAQVITPAPPVFQQFLSEHQEFGKA
jgi:hypothetical protein